MDGEIPRGQAEAIAAHLERCGRCAGHVGEERRIREALRVVALEAVAPRLDASRIAWQVSSRREEEVRIVRTLRRIAAVAAIAVIGCGMVLAWGPWKAPRSAAAQTTFQAVATSGESLALIDEDASFTILLRGR